MVAVHAQENSQPIRAVLFAIAGMVTGAVVVLFWLYAPITINGGSLSAFIYEIIPGFIASTLAILITDAITGAPRGKVKEQYEAMEDHIEEHG